MIKVVFSSALLFLLTGSALGLELEGVKTQGGLLIGRAQPGAQIEYDGRSLRVSADGVFMLGFGRDVPLQQTIKLTGPNGVVEAHVLALIEREYKVQRVDGLPDRTVSPPEKEWDRIARESGLLKSARAIDSATTGFLSGFIWPVEGTVSGVYGSQRILNGIPKRPHYGLDVAASTGTPINAPAEGMVTLIHPDMFYTGGTVVLDHGHGLSSILMHMSAIDVKEGEAVKQGQRIGAVGATGRATGPHLHWGLYWFDTPVDPQLVLAPVKQPLLTAE